MTIGYEGVEREPCEQQEERRVDLSGCPHAASCHCTRAGCHCHVFCDAPCRHHERRGPRDGNDRERLAFRRARDVGAKVVAIRKLLHATWFGSLWRARIPDRDRQDAMDVREARAVRLLVHLHVIQKRTRP